MRTGGWILYLCYNFRISWRYTRQLLYPNTCFLPQFCAVETTFRRPQMAPLFLCTTLTINPLTVASKLTVTVYYSLAKSRGKLPWRQFMTELFPDILKDFSDTWQTSLGLSHWHLKRCLGLRVTSVECQTFQKASILTSKQEKNDLVIWPEPHEGLWILNSRVSSQQSTKAWASPGSHLLHDQEWRSQSSPCHHGTSKP